jgi:hypothetical protein
MRNESLTPVKLYPRGLRPLAPGYDATREIVTGV